MNKIPEITSGQIFFVPRIEYNMTQVWQVQGGRCIVIAELQGIVEQVEHKEEKAE